MTGELDTYPRWQTTVLVIGLVALAAPHVHGSLADAVMAILIGRALLAGRRG